MIRLKRELEAALADHGVELSIPPDGPLARMVDQELVRQQFYIHTPADGSPEQKGNLRRRNSFGHWSGPRTGSCSASRRLATSPTCG